MCVRLERAASSGLYVYMLVDTRGGVRACVCMYGTYVCNVCVSMY